MTDFAGVAGGLRRVSELEFQVIELNDSYIVASEVKDSLRISMFNSCAIKANFPLLTMNAWKVR